MKTLNLSSEALQAISSLCHLALKGMGMEALEGVKKIEAWIKTATESSEPPSPSQQQ